MKFPFSLGLRSKVSLVIFISLLLSFILLGMILHWVVKRQTQETAENQMLETAQLASMTVSDFMEHSQEELEALAKDKVLRSAVFSWQEKAVEAHLENYLPKMKEFITLAVYDRQGYIRAVAGEGRASKGKNFVFRSYFQRTMRTKKTAWGDPVIGVSVKQPILHLAVPIKNAQGEIQNLLVGVLTISRLNQHFKEIRIGHKGFIILISGEGKIVAHPDDSKVFTPVSQSIPGFSKMQEKERGFSQGSDAAGIESLYAWTALSKYQWILVAQRPRQEVYEPLMVTRRLLLLGLFFVLLVAVVSCIYFVNSFVLHPLRQIQSSLEKISLVKIPSRNQMKSGDELQMLAASISVIAGSLHNSYESLARRNRELTVLNNIAAVSSQSLDIQEILDTTLDKALELMNLQVGNVRLYDAVRQKLVIAAWRGVTPEYLQKFTEIDINDQDSYSVQALTKGKAVFVEDLGQDTRLKDFLFPDASPQKIHYLICVPMKVKDKIIGTMGFVSWEDYCFTSEDMDIFSSIGNQLAVAVEKAALLRAEREARERERERARELGVLFATGRLLTTSSNLDEILKSIVDTTCLLLEVNKCNLMLKDDRGYLTFAYTRGIPQELLDAGALAPGESLSGWLADQSEYLYVPRMDEDPRFKFPQLAHKYGLCSFLGISLKVKEKVIGVLNVYTDHPRAFEKEELRLLSTVGDYAAIAIEQARDRQKLETQILQRHRELSVLNAISSTLSRSLDLNMLLEDAIDMIMLVMNADKAAVFFKERENLRLVSQRGFAAATQESLKLLKADECVVWRYLNDHDLRISSPILQPEIMKTMPELEHENIKMALDVRLPGKKENLGFLTVFYNRQREFDEAELHLLVSACNQLAAVLENAQLYQRTLHSYHQQQVVSEINSEISMQLDLGQLLSLIARRAVELMKADASIIGLYDQRSGLVYPKGWFNMPEEIKDYPLVFSEKEWKLLDWQQQGLRWNEERDLPLGGMDGEQQKVNALMVQPLHSQDGFWGLILLLNFNPDKFFQEEDQEFLALLAGQGAVAIQNAQYVKEIVELDQQRENYLSNVSHELRTPITLIRGYADTLKDGVVEAEAEQQKCLEIIIKECDRLTRLVEGLLLLPRLEMADPQKTLHLSFTNINQLLESCLQLLKPELAEKQIVVDNQMPLYPSIWVDADMFFQVFFNLISNALKFVSPGGIIKLEGEVRPREIELVVTDNGPGIPPQHIDRIFDKFFMIDSGLTRKQRGMGLGLYIVKRIVDLHYGHIWVKNNNKGSGTSFYVTLPISRMETQAVK